MVMAQLMTIVRCENGDGKNRDGNNKDRYNILKLILSNNISIAL